MRYFQFALLVVCFSNQTSAQVKETFYDFFWKPCDPINARFFSTIEKTDSGWLRNDYFIYEKRLQMQALYRDEACKINNGKMVFYHANGNVSVVGSMKDGLQQGVCLSFHNNGMMSDSANYLNGIPVGSRVIWYSNGFMSDSIYHLNDSLDVHMEWFDDGKPAAGGFIKKGKPHGKWTYYHYNGIQAGELLYHEGKITSCKYFNEDGSEVKDTATANSKSIFKKNGDQGWQDYLNRKLYWPPNYKFSESGTVTVGVEFTIDENGKIIDPYIYLPFHPEFDKIALEVVKNSPAWKPAVQHNRRIKATRRQPISFSQPE